MLRWSVLGIIAALFSIAVMAEDIRVEVRALFNGKAMLVVNGEASLLSEGDVTEHGLKLVEATSKYAILERDGERQKLTLSNQISTRFTMPETRTVSIPSVDGRSYVTAGSINAQPVTFVVDTGATLVAMSRLHAARLGIQFRLDGVPSSVRTASGLAPMYRIKLDEVKVGAIRMRNVDAGVIDSEFPHEILLGMSFLRELDIREENGILFMTQKY